MKIFIFCLLLCLCVDLIWCGNEKYIKAPKNKIPGSYIVVMKDNSDVDEIVSQVNSHFDKNAEIKQKFKGRMKGIVINLPENDHQDLDELLADPRVDYVEEDAMVSVSSTADSWGLDRIDQVDLPLDGKYFAPGDGTGIDVYVVDSGIQYNQVDFAIKPISFVDVTGKKKDTDCNGHGTHVAGTIGSTTYGVAKNVQLHSVRVFGCTGSAPWSTIIAGINEITEKGTAPAVVNLSLSGFSNQAANDAVQYLKEAGFLPIAAAGNMADDACLYTPSVSPHALTVGATDIDDSRYLGSNYGPCTDIYAPGVNIISLVNSRKGTAVKTGTSMAAPHVAGIAALIWADNPTLSVDQVWSQVLAQATPGKVTGDNVGPNDLLAYV